MQAPVLAKPTSVAAARRALSAAFRDAGLESPELDARILVGFALGLDHAGLAVAADRSITSMESAAATSSGQELTSGTRKSGEEVIFEMASNPMLARLPRGPVSGSAVLLIVSSPV